MTTTDIEQGDSLSLGTPLESQEEIKLLDFVCGHYDNTNADSSFSFNLEKTGEGTYSLTMNTKSDGKDVTEWQCTQDNLSIDKNTITVDLPDYKHKQMSIDLGYYKLSIQADGVSYGTFVKESSEDAGQGLSYSEVLASSYTEFLEKHAAKYLLETQEHVLGADGTISIYYDEEIEEYRLDAKFPQIYDKDFKGKRMEDFSVTQKDIAFISPSRNEINLIVERGDNKGYCVIHFSDDNKFFDCTKYNDSFFEEAGTPLGTGRFLEDVSNNDSATTEEGDVQSAVQAAREYFGSLAGCYDDWNSEMYSFTIEEEYGTDDYLICSHSFNPISTSLCIKVTKNGDATEYLF
ncbi:hypothetical protein SAMN02910298_01235 [Pseudobutyrivibrio sp. YE44]|uniref:hypothetical protein n=1 Tax=Pseudobutyrivibrio sp. YE44 TaxID=1520802 RepID=UPI0008906589|nr:hypothetical protein [Pseudobutyrivibrio sp. YE44]SDB24696.1 hypothetical protein SAMN02910298_01235 [Pseudobutyrivibrio sp. YE44]